MAPAASGTTLTGSASPIPGGFLFWSRYSVSSDMEAGSTEKGKTADCGCLRLRHHSFRSITKPRLWWEPKKESTM
jgi:hypothetical protein